MTTKVGSSSMEILVAIEELGADGKPVEVCLTGRFTMAARNAATLRSQRIAPLRLDTAAERRLFEIGQELKQRKKAAAAASLERVPPTKEEALLLHTTFLHDRDRLAHSAVHTAGIAAGVVSPGGPSGSPNGTASGSGGAPPDQGAERVVTLASTVQSSTLHMHPQQKNGERARPSLS